jgi:hypothetical protein
MGFRAQSAPPLRAIALKPPPSWRKKGRHLTPSPVGEKPKSECQSYALALNFLVRSSLACITVSTWL